MFIMCLTRNIQSQLRENSHKDMNMTRLYLMTVPRQDLIYMLAELPISHVRSQLYFNAQNLIIKIGTEKVSPGD